jgi:hypothetical protein
MAEQLHRSADADVEFADAAMVAVVVAQSFADVAVAVVDID